jgi:predicted Zn-dependent peptidase
VRVLLVNPSWERYVSQKGHRINRSWVPLELLHMASLLRRQGAQVDLIDARARPVAPEELARAVRQLTVQLVDNVRTPYGLGQLLGTVQSIFGEPSRFTRDLAKYTQVTSEDVRRVVARYLIPQNRSVVTLIP